MDKHPTQIPPEAFFRWAVIAIVFVLILLGSLQEYLSGSKFILLALACMPFAIFLVNRLHVWYMAVFGVFYSWIYIPGFPTALSLFYLLALGIIPFLLVGKLLGVPRYRRSGWMAVSTIGYLVIVVITMNIRGFGLRSTGGSLWGGTLYIHIAVAALFYLLSNHVTLSERQWKTVVILFFSMAIFPIMAEWVFLLSKGAITLLYYFIKPEGSSARRNVAIIAGSGEGILRFQTSQYVTMFFVLSLALFPYKGRYRVPIAISFIVACLFAGLSGHRTTAIYILLFVPTVIFFRSRKIPVRLLLAYGIGLGILVILLAIVGPSLPLAAQRAVSWVPFANISVAAQRSAESTTVWRLELWKQLLEIVPEHFFIGRGLAFNPAHLWMIDFSRQRGIDWAIISHNYHSGPLSLLIDFGIVGLVSGSGIMIVGAWRHYRYLSAKWHSRLLQRFHQVILASFCVDVVRFFLIHGDAASSIAAFLVQVAMLEGFVRTDNVMQEEPVAGKVPDGKESLVTGGHIP